MTRPDPAPLPIEGGTYVQHADGRLERVNDVPPPPPAADPPEPTPSTDLSAPKSRYAKPAPTE